MARGRQSRGGIVVATTAAAAGDEDQVGGTELTQRLGDASGDGYSPGAAAVARDQPRQQQIQHIRGPAARFRTWHQQADFGAAPDLQLPEPGFGGARQIQRGQAAAGRRDGQPTAPRRPFRVDPVPRCRRLHGLQHGATGRHRAERQNGVGARGHGFAGGHWSRARVAVPRDCRRWRRRWPRRWWRSRRSGHGAAAADRKERWPTPPECGRAHRRAAPFAPSAPAARRRAEPVPAPARRAWRNRPAARLAICLLEGDAMLCRADACRPDPHLAATPEPRKRAGLSAPGRPRPRRPGRGPRS